ncbi:MAG: Sec-dependent nitrous-oxide reductase [Dehalococcoidia bacterium]|nr:Sec-dependent nitrous-oxide reductase [Dehalococcoidia bacterium]
MAVTRREFIAGSATGAAGLVVGGVLGKTLSDEGDGASGPSGLTGDANSVAEARGLSPAEVVQALKTVVPPGRPDMDEFYILSSGGHSGQILVMGVPSMKIKKVVGVFTPEPWQGFGFGNESDGLLAEGTTSAGGPSTSAHRYLSWADTHHPAISETEGEYDGRFVYINDRANGRIAMVDMRDFKTKQIYDVPNLQSSHGGVFVTQNTEYAHISTKTPTLIEGADPATSLENFADVYRGYSTFLAVDQETGRFDLARSFQVELPPYTQDLADSGKLVSHGWVFLNSYNSEMATGGNLEGKPPIEVGASANDFDYMHIINWQKAEQVVGSRSVVINGMRVIPLDVAVEEGILFLAPEPRSPHGVDVSPDGGYLCVAGKLDPYVTIYSFEKMLAAIEAQDFEKRDQYGIPVLNYDSVVSGRVEVGAGPLHTQYDADGHGYTSLFLESAVAKFTLGEPYFSGDQAYKLVDKVPVHYNIGHLCTMEGDTTKPQGKYLIALNKWSIDRHSPVGTLNPQNFQLVDLGGEVMEVLSDTPIGMAEPHYVQAIRADRIKAWDLYPPGTNPLTMQPDPNAVAQGEERIERDGNRVEVFMSVTRSQFKPDILRLNQGDQVTLHLTNIETTPDATHGFAIPRHNVSVSLDPGEYTRIDFVADVQGSFAMYCTEFCSALHLEMQGWMLVA